MRSVVWGEDFVEFSDDFGTHRADLETGAVDTVERETAAEDTEARPRLVARGFPQTWPSQYEVPSPGGGAFLGLDGHDLKLRLRSGVVRELTRDGTQQRPWELRGASFSHDGRVLFALRSDHRGVGRLPLDDWKSTPAPPTTLPWPGAGGPLPPPSGALFSTSQGGGESVGRIDVDLGGDPYVRVLGFRGDATEVMVATLDRTAQRVRVLAVDAMEGTVRTVLEETTATSFAFPPNFVFRALNAGGGLGFASLADDEHFVWASERSGWRQLYLYRFDGTLVRPLTRGERPVVAFGGADLEGGTFLYTASSDPKRPYDVHVHLGSLDGTADRRLSVTAGQHRIAVSPAGRFYLDTHSTTHRLPMTELRRADGELLAVLSRGGLPDGTHFVPPEHFTAKAADGVTELYGVLLKPANFDPERRYPVIENIYGGAFVTYVPHSFDSGTPWYGDLLFDAGYVEVVIDARGTPGRGRAFQDVAHRRLGQHEIADHAAALRQAAASRPWMDMERVGIFGNSYGGYFAFRALLQAPDTYRAAVAAGLPVMDGDIPAMSTEVYLGRYEEGSEAWRGASNLELVHQLEGELLLVQGTLDTNTPLFGTLRAADALIEAEKHFEMLVVPGANHQMRTGESSRRRYFMERIVRFFDRHLAAETIGGRD
ncbi:MAG: prolyl oligopeptidase family serine peptidase [Acidobacteriota bacterium]